MPVEVICEVLGAEYKIAPWVIEQESYDVVMRYWEVLSIKNAEQERRQEAEQARQQSSRGGASYG